MSITHQAKRLKRFALLGAGYIRRHGVLKTATFATRLVRDHGMGGAARAMKLRLSGPVVNSRYGRERIRSAYTQPHTSPVDIVVCVHNALEDVKRCLNSVLHDTMPPYRLILVDDGSDPATATYLKEFAASQGTLLVRNETAKGYTFAANQGMAAATAEIIVLLNSDTIVTPYWLDRMIACLFSGKKIGLVGPLSNAASWQSIPHIRDGNDWSENPLPAGVTPAGMAAMLALSSPQNYPRVGFLNGFCLMMRAAVIKQVGQFDEKTFGAGYGEENDLCLRAQQVGWELAVADDAYVYHAQSKSYSHERRMALSRQADDALHAKHGDETVGLSLAHTVEVVALEGLRARAKHFAARQALMDETRAKYEGKRVFFLLPIRHAGGGGHVILNEAEALMTMGINVTVVNFASHRAFFEDQHPGLHVPVHYIDSPADIVKLARHADAIIATLFLTVEWMADYLSVSKTDTVMGYYIQDYEPWFFAADDPMYQQAKASYTNIPGMKLMTKSAWNAKVLHEQAGCLADVLGPSYDWQRFYPTRPKAVSGQKMTVAAMIRPATPRRAPTLTARILGLLKAQYGDAIEIVIFGADKRDSQFKLLNIQFTHTNAGEIPAAEMAGLLDSCDIFLDYSEHQAMGLTALEAMASGVAVVAPAEGGAGEFITHEVNGLIVDTRDESACLHAAQRLIEQVDLRHRLQRAAPASVAGFYPERAARQLLDTLFG